MGKARERTAERAENKEINSPQHGESPWSRLRKEQEPEISRKDRDMEGEYDSEVSIRTVKTS